MIEDLGVLGHGPVHTCVPGDVTDQNGFVIKEILTETRVGPSIVEVLETCVFRPIIRKFNQDWLLDVISEKTSFLDLCKPVVEGSRLREVPKCIDEMVGATLGIEVVLLP